LKDRPLLRIDEPVALQIADRRVYQRGMEIPVGKLTRVGLDGWVGFDSELNLTASIPVLPTMLADRPLLGAIAAEAKVRVPIRGTLRKPEIDREAFQFAMKDMGRTLLENGLTKGAVELLDRLGPGRNPDPRPPRPRLTPEQRRERRLERRTERRRRRGIAP
jgi:translocation and assembly module TamB